MSILVSGVKPGKLARILHYGKGVHGEFVIMPPWASEIIRDNVLSIDMTSTSGTY
jgi:hypothetical protein